MSELYEEGFTQNREISWLRFNERCLLEAADTSVPLFERLKFISIFVSNLDEFFMVRVGSLLDMQYADNDEVDNKSGMTPEEQLTSIYMMIPSLYDQKDKLYKRVEKDLRRNGVYCLNWHELSDREYEYVDSYYKMVLEPRLQPIVIRDGESFPNLKNKATYIVGTVSRDDGRAYAILPIPSLEKDFLTIPEEIGGRDTFKYILAEEILRMKFEEIFAPLKVENHAMISITRNADFKPVEENSDLSENFREKMRELVDMRRGFSPDRLDADRKLDYGLEDFLLKSLGLTRDQYFITDTRMSLDYVYDIEDLLPPDKKAKLCYAPFRPVDQMSRRQGRVMDLVKKKDVLSSYPYDSMYMMLNLLKEAAVDPMVREIRMTIYRLASHPMIVEYLIRAAENGKKVRVLMELRARFDEQNNIDWSDRLEEAGCRVYFGDEDYKVHSKLCQIVMKTEDGRDEFITQIGTGNYNEKTAKLYTDLSLITYDQNIGRDAHKFFIDTITHKLDGHYDYILASPSELKTRVIELIEREKAKGEKGRIFIKINSITDADIIKKLSEASCAGVKIRMIVRGICCILPGIEYYTENIDIVNVVGRFLEHSRVYVFGSGEDEVMYIASADFMTRNTERRFELACPIYDSDIKRRIKKILYLNFNDNVKGRRLNSMGIYEKKRRGSRRINSQEELKYEALLRGATKKNLI
jgi:polyphosphate kinase